MRVFKNFNNISEELKKTIPQLQPKETKTFQMLTGRHDVDSHTGEWSMQYPKVQIPSRDRIFDPFKNEYVDWGVVEAFRNNEPTSFSLFIPGIGPSQFSGKFGLNGGVAKDVEWYEYLWLSNYNAKNPNRDVSIEPLFEPIDYLADSKEKLKKTGRLREALNVLNTFDESEYRMIADSQNWPYITEVDILQAKVEEYAKTNPEQFIGLWADPATRVKSEMKRAANAGIIELNLLKKQVLWAEDKSIIATLAFQDQEKWLDSFAEHLTTVKNGPAIREKIRKQMKLPAKITEELVPA